MTSFNKKAITDIFCDPEFRERIKDTYAGSQLQRSFSDQRIQSQFVALYRYMLEKSYRAIENGQRQLAFDLARPERIKNQIITVAQLGLSLDPADKEAYFDTEFGGAGDLSVKIIFGIDGISLLLNKCSDVRSVACNVIYEGDHFEWYGEDESPAFSQDLTNTRNSIIGAWGRIRLTNGDVLCTRIPGHEIEAVATEQVRVAEHFGQQTPWTEWKDKCVRNMVLRRLFKERAKSLNLVGPNVELEESGTGVQAVPVNDSSDSVSDDDFEKLLSSVEDDIPKAKENETEPHS